MSSPLMAALQATAFADSPHAPEDWKRDSELHGAYVLMRHARRLRLPTRNEVLEEEAGAAPATPGRRAARLATECGHLTIRVSSRLARSEAGAAGRVEGAEAGGLAPPRRCRRLASNEGGLLLPNASVSVSGSPSETRTRICSLKDCRPALSRWGQDCRWFDSAVGLAHHTSTRRLSRFARMATSRSGGRGGARTRAFLVRSPTPPASGEGALP